MNDQLDAAVKHAMEPKPETRVDLQMGLPDGRQCRFNLPLPLSADDVIRILVNLPGFIAQANTQAAGRGIALPDGRVVPLGSLSTAPEAAVAAGG